jgi:hypothetical protein
MKQFLILVAATILIGCQSNPPVNTQDSFTAQHTSAKVKEGTFDYQKILAGTSLNKLLQIEQYGVYERPDKTGNVDFIRLRVKLIGFDKQAGTEIAGEKELFDPFLHGITALLAERTAVNKQNIELIMRAGGCQIHALAGSLSDVKCDKAPVKLAGADNSAYLKDSLQQYAECKNAGGNEAFCLDYAASSGTVSNTSVLTKNKLKQFCEEVLAKKFASYQFESACEIVHNPTERYFLIGGIHTKGYLTDGYWEKFAVRLSYLYGKNAGQEFIGDLNVVDGKCVARIILRGVRTNAYNDKLTQCNKKAGQKMRAAAETIAGWFNQYFMENKTI